MNLSIDKLKNLKVAVLGFGVEGQALSKFLEIEKIGHDIIDEAKKSDGIKNIDFADLEDVYDIYFKSPGIVSEKLKNIPMDKISNFTDLFLNLFPGKTIGITGTKGKSTTATLIDAILKDNKKKSYLIGNIGNYDVRKISSYEKNDYAIMELSSFQLEDTKKSPHIAIVLPVIEDHLDHHKDIGEYIAAKSNICKFQKNSDWALVAKDEGSEKVCAESPGRKFAFGKGSTGCRLADEIGECDFENKHVKFVGAKQFSVENLIPEIDMEAALAFMFVEKLHFDPSMFFEKPNYRIELVGESNGAKFYNDSASTNPVSAIIALDLIKGKKIIILGGKSKNLDFSQLFDRMRADDVEEVLLFGELKEELAGLSVRSGIADDTKVFEDLGEVFEHLNSKDLSNKSVIFSPAAASFDQFENAKQRGEKFNELFNKLSNATKI